MIYRFRIILDVKEDVLRDIEIEETATFEDLHHAITQAFGFLGNEMASFYRSKKLLKNFLKVSLVVKVQRKLTLKMKIRKTMTIALFTRTNCACPLFHNVDEQNANSLA